MRTLILLILAAIPSVGANSIRQMKWDELSTLTTKSVSVVMRGGAVVTGKVTAVEPDALVLRVSKTTDKAAYPKGPLRLQRATLRTLQWNNKGHKFRAIGTPLGTVAGLVAGALIGIGINGGIWDTSGVSDSTLVAAVFGTGAAGGVGGYFLGNAADRRVITIEIVP
jgi:hypothetical protein